jgi:hypothetical protein
MAANDRNIVDGLLESVSTQSTNRAAELKASKRITLPGGNSLGVVDATCIIPFYIFYYYKKCPRS